MEDHRDLAALAARQYGVVTREQLKELGYSDDAIDHAVASGRLEAWHRGIFAFGLDRLSPHGLCMGAVLSRGPGALLSHQSAVWLWGLERKLEIPVHVSVRRRGRGEDAIGLHHCPALRDDDIAETERLPVTSVARTLLDYAFEANPFRLARAIDQADRLDLLDRACVESIAEAAVGHPGRIPLLRAMGGYRGMGVAA
jgi:hypothetical protein